MNRNRCLPVCMMALASLALAACSPEPAPQADAPAAAPATVSSPSSATIAPPASVAVAQDDETRCTHEPRTDEHDKRPRCGGMGIAPPAPHAYRIVVGGGDPVDQVVCDIGKVFVLDGKLFGTEFSGGMEGTYRMVRTPNVPGMQWKGSGTYRIDLPGGPDAPGTLHVKAKEATTKVTTTGITDENAGYTDAFAMTPVEACKS